MKKKNRKDRHWIIIFASPVALFVIGRNLLLAFQEGKIKLLKGSASFSLEQEAFFFVATLIINLTFFIGFLYFFWREFSKNKA